MISTFELIQRFDELNHSEILSSMLRDGTALPDFTLAVTQMQLDNRAIFGPIRTEVGKSVSKNVSVINSVVKSLFMDKRKVEAIKALRIAYDIGLKEAKWLTDCLDGSRSLGELDSITIPIYAEFVASGLYVPEPHVAPPTPPAPTLAGVYVVTCLEPLCSQPTSDIDDFNVKVLGITRLNSEAWDMVERDENTSKDVRYQVVFNNF